MLKGPIALATIRTSFVLGLRLFVQAGTLLLVARMLGPEQFGAFAGVTALAVLMGTFSTFGTHLVLLGEVAKDPIRRESVYAYALPITLLCGGLLFFLYIFLCRFFLHEAAPRFNILLCIGLTETMLLPLFVLAATEQLALEKTARSQLFMTLPLVFRMLVAGGIMLLSPADPLALFAYGYVITAILALFVMKHYNPGAWIKPAYWRLPTGQQLKHSAGYATLALTATGPSELDKMLATKLLPLGTSGLYAAASRITGAATLPVIALLLSALPRLFRDAEYDALRNQKLTRWIFISVFIYGCALGVLLWITAPVFEWLFGEKYRGIGEMVQWLCLAVPGMALRISGGSILMSMNKPLFRATFELFGLIILVIVSIILVKHLGTHGMPLALVCSEWVMALLCLRLITHVRGKSMPTAMEGA